VSFEMILGKALKVELTNISKCTNQEERVVIA
jgi:hypothetical protein